MAYMEHEHLTSFYKLSTQEALEQLSSTRQGLSNQEAKNRLNRYGPNSIDSETPFNYLETIIGALKNPFSIILLIASGLSFTSNHIIDGFVIVAVLITNISIELYHQKSAFRNIQLLGKNIEYKSPVLRNGVLRKIPSEDIVPGDIVMIEEGDRIPADGRILESSNLSINESALTGESSPVEKSANRLVGTTPLLEQRNMAWLGSTTTTGSGTLLVTATGFRTHFGNLSQELQNVQRGSNPFLERISKLSKTLGIAGLIVVLTIFSIRYGILGNDLKEIILFSLAVLVSIIPESLPTVINITLAQGAKYLAKEHAVVKELSNIESIGSTSVLVTDKTGTLTENSMKVEYVVLADGSEFSVTGFGWKTAGMFMYKGHKFDPNTSPELSKLLDFSIISNRSDVYEEDGKDKVIGEPTEAALLILAQKSGRERNTILQEYTHHQKTHFFHKRNILVSIVEHKGKLLLITIGAPETIWNISNANQEAKNKTEEFAHQGLRTIAYAYKEISQRIFSESLLQDLNYMGFVAMRDPIREGAKEVINKAIQSDIRIIMATGDHRKTAEHIGRELGIVNNSFPNIIEGSDFINKTEKEQKQILTNTNVFARVTPETKLQIAKLLQKQKEVVTMIGDGVNDTLALKQADVGVAMGSSGTDAARSASSIVLTDDNFKTIILAIFRGRHIYANIRNVTNFLLSTNAAEALVLVLVTFFGLPLPLAATQILLINLVTDGLGSLPFAFRKPGTTMLPRPQSGKLLTGYDYGLIGSATIGMTIATLVGFSMFLDQGIIYAQTIAFTILALTQIGRLVSLDSTPGKNKISEFFKDVWLFRSVGISLVIVGLVLAIPPLRQVFNFDILRALDIVVAFGLSLTPFVTVETYKAIVRIVPKKYYA